MDIKALDKVNANQRNFVILECVQYLVQSSFKGTFIETTNVHSDEISYILLELKSCYPQMCCC